MGHRSLAMLFGAASLVATQMASALGLGEVSVNSSLNQPLDAEIRLLQVRDLTQREILIGLASRDDFERIGVDRPYFLSDLKFELDMSSPAGPVVKVTSTKPVREPFLNFIIQAQWPSGKVLREYTLLLDLPVFSDAPAQPVAATQTASARSSEKKPVAQAPQSDTRYNPRSSFEEGRTSSSRTSAVSQESTSQSSAYAGVDVIGPVKANQTLWEIASQVKPDRTVTVQQTMLAIQRLNPDAFINNNINLLKRGQILRIPDAAQIKEFSRQEAVRSVAQQNAAWSGGASDSDVQLSGSKSYASQDEESSKAEGRLKLYSPEDSSDSVSGRTTGSGSSSSEALQNELAATLEQLEKTNRDNHEMRSKIESLEEQIRTMERLVEVSNEDMRALELAAKKNQELSSAAEEVSSQSSVPEIEKPEIDLSFDGTDSASEEAVDTSAEEEKAETPPAVVELDKPEEKKEEVVQPKPDPSKVVRAAKKPEPSIVDLIMENILFVALGVVAILGALILFFRSRSSKEEMEEDDFLDQPEFEAPEADEEDLLALGDIEGDDNEYDLDAPASEETEVVEADVPAEAETGDAAAEADIYIAYGKYDQAEEMLVTALEKDPSNIEARLKLLEVYSSQGDIDKFDPHFAKIYAEGNASFVERGQQLRAGIAGAHEFDPDLFVTDTMGETVAPVEEAEIDADSLDFELDVSEAVEEEVEPVSDDVDFGLANLDEEPTQDDGSLDFDLDLGELDSNADEVSLESSEASLDDLELSLDLDDASSEESPAADEDDFSLDFDLDGLGGEDETTISPAAEGPGEEASVADEFDLSDEFLSLDSEGDAQAESVSVESDLISDDLDEDLDSIDFDLGIEDFNVDTAEGDAEAVEGAEGASVSLEDDLAALDLDLEGLDLDDDSSGMSGDAEGVSLEEDDFDLGELSLETGDDAGELSLDDLDALNVDESAPADIDLDALDLDLDDLSLEGSADPAGETETADEVESDESISLDAPELSLDEEPELSLGDEPELSLDEEPELSLGDEPELSLDDELELSLDDELDDLALDDLDLGGDVGQEAPDLDLDIEALDAELEASGDMTADVSSDVSADAEGGESLELANDLDAELDADLASSVEPEAAEEVALDEGDLSDDLGATDLESDGDLDLSALDDELDALTGDLDLADLEADFSEEALASSTDFDDAPEPLEVEESAISMEEPVTDFGDDDIASLDEELSLDAEPEVVSEPESEMGDDTLFTKAISDVPEEDLDFELPEIDPDSMDDDSDLGFLSDSDETATKLDLARAYIDMGDSEGAKDIIEEIQKEGNEQQKAEADKLLEKL